MSHVPNYPPSSGGALPGQVPNSSQYVPGMGQYQEQHPGFRQMAPQTGNQQTVQGGQPFIPTSGAGYAPANYQYPGNVTQPNSDYAGKQQYPEASGQSSHHGLPEKTPWNPSQASAYSGSDIPADDVGENDAEETVTASAPSYDFVVSGYENIGGADVSVGPPPSYEESFQSVPAVVDAHRIPRLTDDEAREALLKLVGKKSCWGSGAARDMDIKDVVATSAYHYVLETFTEGRSTSYEYEPYRGGYVDSPNNGPAPLPWSIPCSPNAFFRTEKYKIPVPHTDVIRPCHLCRCRGFNRCGKCRGRGRVKCGFCHGHGRRDVTSADGERRWESCTFCNGRGRKKCLPCHGSGCIVCVVCQGYGNLKQFIQLTVKFTNRHSDHVVERSDLPDELIRDVQGDTMFEQTQLRVCPIENFFDSEINSVSKQLVTSHGMSWPAERILQQRHYLRSVPVHECSFEYGEKHGRFWVYGHQKEVFTEDYPHTCCCCRCTIL